MKDTWQHLDIKVFGQVQGVSFRARARQRAKELGLTGCVKNEPDGSVSLEAEGDPESLGEFLAWCREGTPLSEIERVDYEQGPVVGYADFVIDY